MVPTEPPPARLESETTYGILFAIIADLFRDHEQSGWAKFGWVVFLIFLPFLAVLIYVIVRGKGMAQRNARRTAQAQGQFDEYVRQTAATGGPAGELEKLQALKDKGAIDDADYTKLKAKIVGA